ncbi:cupin domain-containing protein [Streptantibioticus parmotrematis]|uniref:cupin domain-containing protein n=1 Tax=Streptantibioticus parmotrematis TaxID=2873249 RepID=UPI0033FEE0A4
MYVKTADSDEQIRKNGCDLRQLYPWDGVVVPPWNSTLCSIRPTESSTPHEHATDETFIFTGGEGHVRIGTEERDVASGDVIYIPNGTHHIVTNTSDAETLTFVSIYWLQPNNQ